MAHPRLKIGEVARAVGLNPRTIRYYERCGLLKISRTVSGYRVFEGQDLTRLKLVKQLRRVRFSIAETKQVLPILVDQRPPSQKTHTLKALLQRRLAVSEQHLRESLAVHQELQARLKRLSAKRRSGKASCCEPFCGPQTCGPGLVKISGLTEQAKTRRE